MRGKTLRRAEFALTFELWKVLLRLTGGGSFGRGKKQNKKKPQVARAYWIRKKTRLLVEIKLVCKILFCLADIFRKVNFYY